MTLTLPARLRVLFLLLIALTGAAQAWTQLIPAGRAQFSDLEVLPDQSLDGLRGVAVRFKLQTRDVTPTATPQAYYVSASLLDEGRLPVHATEAASRHTDRQGLVRDSLPFSPTPTDVPAEALTLFIPYVAMSVPAGEQRASVLLRLHAQGSGEVLASAGPIETKFTKPAMQLYRMAVERIVTYTTDADGETWDYKFLNAKDVYPELIWSLRRGNQLAFESPKQKNDTVFVGTPQDRSPWIWHSTGDRMHFYVHDFDLLGFSDLVGNLGIDVLQPGFRSGRSSELTFQRVRQATLVQDLLPPPQVTVTGLDIVEGTKHEGVTGVSVHLDYAVQRAVIGGRYFLSLDVNGQKPRMVRIVGPGAVPAEGGRVELIAGSSHLELFIPQVAMPRISGNLRFEVASQALVDGQWFVLGRQSRPLDAKQPAISDAVYGQWSAGAHDLAGRGGIRIAFDYEIPAMYFQGGGTVAFDVLVSSPFGSVAPELWEVQLPDGAVFRDGLLRLTEATRSGTLELFLPFAVCPPGGGNIGLEAVYSAVYLDSAGSMPIGRVARGGNLEVPVIRPLELGLREASVVRRQWLLSNPDMYWELYCGNKLLLRSRVAPETRHAKWEDVVTKTVVAATDRLEFRVYHKEADGVPDQLLEIWTGQVSDLPGKEKGIFRLQTHNLKKMSVWMDYLDKGR